MGNNQGKSINEDSKKRIPMTQPFLHKWLRYPKYNQFINGVDIIPFKAPLRTKFNAYLTKEQMLEFKEIYEYTASKNKPLTDIIDLTTRAKYYDVEALNLPSYNVTYHKFEIRGKSMPNDKMIESIINKIDELLKNNRVVGIHCAHGVNRTGFIVCSYLVRRMEWKPEVALEEFEKARGQGIIHAIYRNGVLKINKAASISA